MTTPIPDDLWQEIEGLAKQEQRPIGELVKDMVAVYKQQTLPTKNGYHAQAHDQLQKQMFKRARRYWAAVGDHERLALSDEELEAQFWLFDHDGVPRLKSDQPDDDASLPTANRHTPYQ